jgi:hypothetical protein
MKENKCARIWNEVLNTSEWKKFDEHIKKLKESIKHQYDFCDYSGCSDADLDDQEEYLEEIVKSIECISQNVKKFHIE